MAGSTGTDCETPAQKRRGQQHGVVESPVASQKGLEDAEQVGLEIGVGT